MAVRRPRYKARSAPCRASRAHGMLGRASRRVLRPRSSSWPPSLPRRGGPPRERALAGRRVLPSVIVPPDASERDLLVGEACRRALGTTAGAVVAMDPLHRARDRPGQSEERAVPRLPALLGLQDRGGDRRAVRGRHHSRRPSTTARRAAAMWPGHGPIDLRRALAVSCNPYFEWVGEQLGYEKIQQLRAAPRPGRALGHQPHGRDRRARARVRAPGVRGPSLEPRRGHRDLGRPARGARLRHGQRRRRLPAAGGRVRGFRSPGALAPPRGDTARRGWPRASCPRSTRAAPPGAFDPDVMVAGKTGTCSSLGWFASYAPADRPSIVLVVFLRHGSGPPGFGSGGTDLPGSVPPRSERPRRRRRQLTLARQSVRPRRA